MTEYERLAPPLDLTPPAPSGPSRPPPRPTSRRWLAIAGAVLVLATIGAALLVVRGGGGHDGGTTPSAAPQARARAQARLDAVTVAAREWYVKRHPERSVMGIGVEQITGDGEHQSADVVLGASVHAGAKDYRSVRIYWDRVHLSGHDTSWSATADDPVTVPRVPPGGTALGPGSPGTAAVAEAAVSAATTFLGYDTSRIGPSLAAMRAILAPDVDPALPRYLKSIQTFATRYPGYRFTVEPVALGFTELGGRTARVVLDVRVQSRSGARTYQPERWVLQVSLHAVDDQTWKVASMQTVSGPDNG